MNESKVLHRSRHYTACVTSAGLTVQTVSGGVLLPPNHPQYAEYVAAISDAVSFDGDEADLLCLALTLGV